MAPPVLPLDVLSTIVDSGSFSKHDLCMISLASVHLRYEAQRKLFRDPGQHCIDVDADSNELFTASTFLHTIICSPDRLALMVRRYHVTLSWHDVTSPKIPGKMNKRSDAQNMVFYRLARGLFLMTKLTELQLYTGKKGWRDPAQRPSIAWILSRCTFRLQFFRCSYRDADHNDQKLVRAFLCNQPDIRALWICEINPAVTRNWGAVENSDGLQDVCPSAVSVGGCAEIIIDMLLAGRRLQHICWDDIGMSSRDDFFQTACFSNVELMENFKLGPKLDLICSAFQNLVLYKTECRTDVFESPKLLRNLPRLRVLIIVFESSFLHLFTYFSQREEGFIRRIFFNSLSLQYIEVHNHDGGKRYIIDRATQVITVYTVPGGIPLHSGERKEELLQRVTVRVGPNDVFLKTFLL